MSHTPRSFRFPSSRPAGAVRTRLLAPLLLVAGLAAPVACGIGSEPPQTESGTQSAGPVTRVEIDADTGSVELRPGPERQSQVQRTLSWTGDRKPEYTQTQTGDTLKVTARCPDGNEECRTDLVVTVPATASSRTEVTTGSITVDGLTGAQDLGATTGRVSGAGLGPAPVTVRTTTGQVSLDFAAAPPTVDAEATTGNVEIRLPVGPVYQVQAQVRTGQSRVEVADTPGADHRISARSTTGNVTVTNR